MARHIRIINARDFVSAKPDGALNLEESEQLLREVVSASDPLEEFDILIDTREAASTLSATDLYQVLDTSDLPGGALNIVTGSADELAKVLASHSDVDAVWRHDGSAEGCAEVERLRWRSIISRQKSFRAQSAAARLRLPPIGPPTGCTMSGSGVITTSRTRPASSTAK